MNNSKTPTSTVELSTDQESTYEVEGRKYIVTSVFREDSSETFGGILLKLIKEEAQRKKR